MAKAQKIIGVNPKLSYQENGHIILPQRLEEVFSWERFIRDPKRQEELHNMRISIRRLRYTMEFFSVNYDDRFSDMLETIVEIQDILGDIHDSDVVLDVLTEYKNNCQSDMLSGVDTLIVQTQKKRNTDYRKFLCKWEELSSINFRKELLRIFES